MSNKANTRTPATAPLRTPYKAKHPFEAAFLNMGDHSPEDALEALTNAIREDLHDENAYDWVQRALPGAVMKPGHAFGTLGQLYKSFARGQEYIRFTNVLQRSH